MMRFQIPSASPNQIEEDKDKDKDKAARTDILVAPSGKVYADLQSDSMASVTTRSGW